MSYSHLEIEDAEARPAFLPQLGRYARLALWSVLQRHPAVRRDPGRTAGAAAFTGGQSSGGRFPRRLGAITLDGQPGELLQMVRSRVPHDIYLNGDYYSAGTLISDGLWLVAVVAICRTASTALATLLLDRR